MAEPYFTDEEQELIEIIAIYAGYGAYRCHIVLEDFNLDDDDLDFYISGPHQADPLGVGIMQALKRIPRGRREEIIQGHPSL